jgi:hypothetical protein
MRPNGFVQVPSATLNAGQNVSEDTPGDYSNANTVTTTIRATVAAGINQLE